MTRRFLKPILTALAFAGIALVLLSAGSVEAARVAGGRVTAVAFYSDPTTGGTQDFNSTQPANTSVPSDQQSAQSNGNTSTGSIRFSPNGGSLSASHNARTGPVNTVTSRVSASARGGVRELLPNMPYRVRGVWAASGGGSVLYRTTNNSNGAGTFNFVRNSTVNFELRANSGYTNRLSPLSSQTGSAAINFSVTDLDEPDPGLQGERSDDPLPVQDEVSDRADFASVTDPQDFTGARLTNGTITPITGDHGRTKPLFFGSFSSPLATSFSNDALTTVAAASTPSEVIGYGFSVEENFFSSFTLPFALSNSDTEFTVFVEGQEFSYSVGDTLDFTEVFPTGVSTFFLLDDDAENSLPLGHSGLVLPFVSGLQFMNDSIADLAVAQFLAVPEPSGFVLAVFGMLSLVCRRRK